MFFTTASARAAVVHPTRDNKLLASAAARFAKDYAVLRALVAADEAVSAAAKARDAFLHAANAVDAAATAAYAGGHFSNAVRRRTTWEAVSHDADFIAAGGGARALASMPLWPHGEPVWAGSQWQDLKITLARKGDWQVWIDWYNRRLEGVSDPEEIELVFATIPKKALEAGPAAANKWIRERLEELKRLKEPSMEEIRASIKRIVGEQPNENAQPSISWDFFVKSETTS